MDTEDRQLMNDEIKYTSQGTFFTWDEEKARQNWQKHGVSFKDVADVFSDVYAIDLPDMPELTEEDFARGTRVGDRFIRGGQRALAAGQWVVAVLTAPAPLGMFAARAWAAPRSSR